MGFKPQRNYVRPHYRNSVSLSSTPPPPRLVWDWGTPPLAPKGPGTSHWGTPTKHMGPVEVLWDGDGVPHPPKGHGTSGSITGWRWGTPPPPGVNWQTETIAFPHPSDASGKDNNINLVYISVIGWEVSEKVDYYRCTQRQVHRVCH